MHKSIDMKILEKKKELSKKQNEIAELKADILYLETLKREMRVPEPIFEEEYFVIPKRIIECYLESIF